MAIDKAGMRLQMSASVVEWGVSCGISRFSGSLQTDGRISGSFVSVATQVLWIQPRSGRLARDPGGLLEETSHVAFQSFGGYDMRAEDRVLPTGETEEFDVTAVHVHDNHRMIEMKRAEET